jgi:UDP-N-acetylmuramate--alanine ligase
VIEADEYDRSFLKLSPDIAVITAMDADHLDIYGNAAAVEQAFVDFSERVKPGGMLLSKYGLAKENALKASIHETYSIQNSGAYIFSEDIRIKNGSYEFNIKIGDWSLKNVRLNMGGMHNVENITAAIGVAKQLEIEDELIKQAVSSFKGVKRRFEYIMPAPLDGRLTGDFVFIDDYAHHPEELSALINGAKGLYPDRKCLVIFQPHLFTRTRDFVDGFAASLDLADEVWLLPIYPARELPIEGVTSDLILSRMKKKEKYLFNKEELLEKLKEGKSREKGKVLLITAGAGDIDTLVDPIKSILETKR